MKQKEPLKVMSSFCQTFIFVGISRMGWGREGNLPRQRMEPKRRQKAIPNQYPCFNDPRIKNVRITRVSLQGGGEAGVNMWNFSFLNTTFYRLLQKSSSGKTASIKSSLLKLNTVFGVVMVILVKNNYRESIVYENEAVMSVICFKRGKQAAFSNNYYILGSALHKSRGIYSQNLPQQTHIHISS